MILPILNKFQLLFPLLYNAGHSTSYGRYPTSVSLCSCVLCKDRRTILHYQQYTHTSVVSILLLFCTVLTISISIWIF